jgi:hypothetical protein
MLQIPSSHIETIITKEKRRIYVTRKEKRHSGTIIKRNKEGCIPAYFLYMK